jgi:hypothetical protein
MKKKVSKPVGEICGDVVVFYYPVLRMIYQEMEKRYLDMKAENERLKQRVKDLEIKCNRNDKLVKGLKKK